MAGLYEGGNEPPGSLKASCEEILNTPGIWNRVRRAMRHRCEACIQGTSAVEATACEKKNVPHDAETDQEEEKELLAPLAEKKLPTEGCIGRNGEREKSWE
ncbi:hypothetical protein ANN_14886 [Periplaneta americana]|uniref:Uncharacterized protein n=1 Tax=Periplaneta americana TaxID=6978 RepID=A0ABQ8SZ55_PERAM|nr:hypothetical protein ANN_14886 [Periplaneta americana]